MKKVFTFTFAFIFIAMMTAMTVAASEQKDSACGTKWLCSQELTFECQKFYNNSNYYTISKWLPDTNSNIFSLDEQNTRYSYYDTNVEQALEFLEWTSSPSVKSVIVKTNDSTLELDGGTAGKIQGKNIEALTFCGYRTPSKSSASGGSGGSGNGVPEFPALSAVAAVLVVTLGIVFLRRN